MTSPAPTPPWRLHPLAQPDLPADIPVPDGGLTLGRDPRNSLVFSASGHPGVSGFHCKLWVADGQLFVEDLGSKNGTMVDGERVEKATLRPGTTLSLGSNGPRFAVLDARSSRETVLMTSDRTRTRRSIGPETTEFVRQQLGISAGGGVEEMLTRQRRRTHRLMAAMGVVLTLVVTASIWALSQLGGEAVAELKESFRRDLEAQRSAWRAETEALQQTWEERRRQLEQQRDTLENSIRELRARDQFADDALAELQSRLESTTRMLESYDPVSLERETLGEVRRVEHAVVMIEVRKSYRDRETGESLRLTYDDFGVATPNTDGIGEELVRESSGSGFCISPEGWIFTNAHVALKKGDDDELYLGRSTFLPEIELSVVFSGTSRRHPAAIEAWRSDGDEDLALLKIEPFEGMPFLPDADVDVNTGLPPQGSDVFLIGFPLGMRAMQQGETVIASTFRGIVSRHVDEFLQVDAAVHPGASGGPVIDGNGRVLGVVVGMQATDEYGGASSAIGYIIPIRKAAPLWPRR